MFKIGSFNNLILNNMNDEAKTSFLLNLFYNSLYGEENSLEISEIIAILEEESMSIAPPKFAKIDLSYKDILDRLSKRLSLQFFEKKIAQSRGLTRFWLNNPVFLRDAEFNALYVLFLGEYREFIKDIFKKALEN